MIDIISKKNFMIDKSNKKKTTLNSQSQLNPVIEGFWLKNIIRKMYIRWSEPQQSETSLLTYVAGQLVPQGSCCISIPILKVVGLLPLFHSIQLHSQKYLTEHHTNWTSVKRSNNQFIDFYSVKSQVKTSRTWRVRRWGEKAPAKVYLWEMLGQ